MRYKNHDVIYSMLKNGYSKEEIFSFVEEDRKENRSQDFVSFMQDMLTKYGMKRKEIADITGMSQDYLYKVLNGSKKTNERDYLIAIALAIGMNINESQHILDINGLHVLDTRDLRDHILFKSIEDGVSFHRVNERLYKAGLPYLRVNKDMEKYATNYSNSLDNGIYEFFSDDEHLQLKPVLPKNKYTEIAKEIEAEKLGDISSDYAYWGNIIVEDENGNRFYIQGYYDPVSTVFSVLDDENHEKYIEWCKDCECEVNQPYELKEYYESFDEAFNSDFFRFFLEIDRETDKKVKETMEAQNDTANYGERIGIRMGDQEEGNTFFIEYYDKTAPALKQYLQVLETKDGITYSASHESVFMRLELDNMFEAFYGFDKKPEYYIKTELLEEVWNNSPRIAGLFEYLKMKMHIYINQSYPNLLNISEEDLLKEQMTTIGNAADYEYQAENYTSSLELNSQLLDMIKQYEELSGIDMTNDYVFHLHKVAVLNSIEGNEEEAQDLFERVLSYKNEIEQKINIGLDMHHAANSIANVLQDRYNEAAEEKDIAKTLRLVKETIDFLENININQEGGEILFMAYLAYADRLDDKNQKEEVINYYEKAYSLLRKYHLDSIPDYFFATLRLLNNYSWLLWNGFSDSQAIYYLIKELELIEDHMGSDIDGSVGIQSYLERCGNRLYDIYSKEGKNREAEKLKIRLKKLSVSL